MSHADDDDEEDVDDDLRHQESTYENYKFWSHLDLRV